MSDDAHARRESALDEWFPVATTTSTARGTATPFELLEDRWLLLCDPDGAVSVVSDTCPHRGAQLSLGSYENGTVVCPYHGWNFDSDGLCVHQPAHPDRTPPAATRLGSARVTERYGLWWACVGSTPRDLPSFADHDADRAIVIEAARVDSSGPRIIENFLDQAHFPFVHAGYLGEVPNTEITRYDVAVVDGELRLSDCDVWQPRPWPTAETGAPVRYDYVVSHPYAAMLRKVPGGAEGDDGFSILLVASPVTETSCRVFRVVVMRADDVDRDRQQAFNQTILSQDIPVVESQRPRRLPLDSRAELHQPADAGSLAYRRWLRDRGVTYGTIPPPLDHPPTPD
ncbi:MAG: aromatic ring-hydroxylating dioxygenase subunit alpha [Acidimicrobiales bacterium]